MFPQYDLVVAIFNPPRLDDLKPSALPLVGEIGVWYPAWKNEDDATNCPGEWAMSPKGWPEWQQKRLRGDFCWVPLSDLVVLEILDRSVVNVFDAARRVRHWRKQKAPEVQAIRARLSAIPRSFADLMASDEHARIETQPIKPGTAMLITRLKGGPWQLRWHEQPGGVEAINALWHMYPSSQGWTTTHIMTWGRTLNEQSKCDVQKWAEERYGVTVFCDGPPVNTGTTQEVTQ